MATSNKETIWKVVNVVIAISVPFLIMIATHTMHTVNEFRKSINDIKNDCIGHHSDIDALKDCERKNETIIAELNKSTGKLVTSVAVIESRVEDIRDKVNDIESKVDTLLSNKPIVTTYNPPQRNKP